MASNVIRVSLLADASKMKAGLSDADKAVGKTEKSMTDFGKAAVAGMAVVAAGAVISFAKQSVQAFSDVEQSAGAVESVFGESADAITSKAEGAAEAFGLSASEFQSSAALIGSMLKNQMGLSAEEAAERVEDLTGKAADMAATFGGTTSEAISAIGSLLRGERDPIERYGVSMNDAAISARALELGLADASGQVDKTAKATAALDILNEQTADSAGQFARESDTLAGSQQILAAKIENAKAAIGEQLAPAVTAATDAMDALIPIVETLTSVIGGASDAMEPMLENLKTTVGIAPEAGVGLESVGAALVDTIPFFKPVQAGWYNINELLGLNAEKSLDSLRAMEDERTHGLKPNVEAQEDLTGAIRDTIDVRQEGFDQMQAQLDPFFNYTNAVDAQAEAQVAVNEAVKEFGKKSPEHIEALKNKAEAGLAVEEAELRMAAAGGITREEFEKQRVKMGLTAAEAQILIDKYDLIFTPRSVSHSIKFYTKNLGDATGRLPGTQHGGEVQGGAARIVGEAGPEVFVPASNGRITSPREDRR